MPSPSYATSYELNERTLLFWGQEKVTAGTVAATFNKEEFGTFSWTPNRNIWVNNFRDGFPSRRQGSYTTWQTADLTWTGPFHAGGFAGTFLVDILGDVTNTGTVDTKAGLGDPYTHTVVPGANSTRCVTFSLVFVSLMDGGATPGLQFLYATPKLIKLSGASGSPLMAELQFTSYFPTSVAAPTGTWNTPNTYTFGYQSHHSIIASGGTAYTAQVTDADVVIARQVTPVPSYNNSGSQNPIDIIPYDLGLQANVSLYYDGMTTAPSTKHFSEYLSYLKAGTTGATNILKWTDANSPAHSVELDFWPAAWSVDNLQTADGLMTCSATLDAEQDFGTATGVTPAFTLLKQAVLLNNVSTVMAI